LRSHSIFIVAVLCSNSHDDVSKDTLDAWKLCRALILKLEADLNT